MALNWELGRIENWEAVCQKIADFDAPSEGIKEGDKILNPVTRSIIWATIAVDMGKITEENAVEFYRRLHAWEKIGGSFLQEPIGPVDPLGGASGWKAKYITLADVKAHIGLATNVPTKSQAVFAEKLLANVYIPTS